MKKYIILLALFSVLSCDDDNNRTEPVYDPDCVACGVASPQDNLDWLMSKIAAFEKEESASERMFEVYVYVYEGQELILFSFDLKSLASPQEVYDCQGNKIEVSDKMYLELNKKTND